MSLKPNLNAWKTTNPGKYPLIFYFQKSPCIPKPIELWIFSSETFCGCFWTDLWCFHGFDDIFLDIHHLFIIYFFPGSKKNLLQIHVYLHLDNVRTSWQPVFQSPWSSPSIIEHLFNRIAPLDSRKRSAARIQANARIVSRIGSSECHSPVVNPRWFIISRGRAGRGGGATTCGRCSS